MDWLHPFSVMGVNGWVLLQVAIGFIVCASWSYLRQGRKQTGGQPKVWRNF